MTEELLLDERGRITIPQAYRRIFRQRVVAILTPHGVLLRPVPDTLPDRGTLPAALEDVSGDDALYEEIDEELREEPAPPPRK
jgi:bifunctional DNA-binding transcriptional regulator/antitoxin component of YhaV-PrlF toxin-antitoxin module